MSDPVDIFSQLKNLTDEIDISWQPSGMGPYDAHFNILVWPLSVQANSDDPVYDYYLVQIEGQASFISPSDGSGWQLLAYQIEIGLGGANLEGNLEFVDNSPDTTPGSTSYTTGITTTVGGSIGFMGEAPTATASASVSLNNSSTRSISDISIANTSRQDGATSGQWRFTVAPNSPSFTSNCPINVEGLWRMPHGTQSDLAVFFELQLTGGDPAQLDALSQSSSQTDSGWHLDIYSPERCNSPYGQIRYTKYVPLIPPPAPNPN